MKDEALKLALEVMHNQGDVGVDEWIAAEAAINQALAAPVQEPVACSESINKALMDAAPLLYQSGYKAESAACNAALLTLMAAQPAPVQLVAGLEQCEFDDECEFCKSPQGGSFTRLSYNAEDCTEAEFYICGDCVHEALRRYTTPPAAPVQEPYGWVKPNPSFNSGIFNLGSACPSGWVGSAIDVYTTPPAAQRKPLTDEQIIEWVESGEYNVITNDWASHIEFARAIEAKLKELNT
jgi:hypothetical protein